MSKITDCFVEYLTGVMKIDFDQSDIKTKVFVGDNFTKI